MKCCKIKIDETNENTFKNIIIDLAQKEKNNSRGRGSDQELCVTVLETDMKEDRKVKRSLGPPSCEANESAIIIMAIFP